ncbi:MAG: hypothetical protein CM1200mP20_08850 [Pseudomonadota bacterium]|nr:MAG: hypothetical protein CM1200mP20_08850 [Pseudomonadota bacterium]
MFFGWAILAVTCFAMIGTGPGQSHLIGLYFDSISAEMTFSFAADWMERNRQIAIAIAYGSATFLAAFLLPQIGKLIDRYGPTIVLSAVIAGWALPLWLQPGSRLAHSRDWLRFSAVSGPGFVDAGQREYGFPVVRPAPRVRTGGHVARLSAVHGDSSPGLPMAHGSGRLAVILGLAGYQYRRIVSSGPYC